MKIRGILLRFIVSILTWEPGEGGTIPFHLIKKNSDGAINTNERINKIKFLLLNIFLKLKKSINIIK